MSFSTDPYTITIPTSSLTLLRTSLEASRIPPPFYEGTQPSYGITSDWLKNAKDRWLHGYDWRAFESHLNTLPNFLASLPVPFSSSPFKLHYLHYRSSSPSIKKPPLVLCHGWPGSFLEFLSSAELLSSSGHDVIVPSLPGYAFSSPPPSDREFGTSDVADLLDSLMLGLGYESYGAQGGDWGTAVVRHLSRKEGCKAVHFNYLGRVNEVLKEEEREGLKKEEMGEEDRKGLERAEWFTREASAYALEHATRPSTISHVLYLSPLALLAWNGEKFLDWVDTPLPLDTILNFVTLWWLTDTYPTSIYYYREAFQARIKGETPAFIEKPTGYSAFPKEISRLPPSWANRVANIVWKGVSKEGGHFAALERPEIFAAHVTEFFDKAWPKEG